MNNHSSSGLMAPTPYIAAVVILAYPTDNSVHPSQQRKLGHPTALLRCHQSGGSWFLPHLVLTLTTWTEVVDSWHNLKETVAFNPFWSNVKEACFSWQHNWTPNARVNLGWCDLLTFVSWTSFRANIDSNWLYIKHVCQWHQNVLQHHSLHFAHVQLRRILVYIANDYTYLH